MPVTEAVFGHNLQSKYLGVQSAPFGGNKGVIVEGPTWYHRVAVGQPYLLVQSVFR